MTSHALGAVVSTRGVVLARNPEEGSARSLSLPRPDSLSHEVTPLPTWSSAPTQSARPPSPREPHARKPLGPSGASLGRPWGPSAAALQPRPVASFPGSRPRVPRSVAVLRSTAGETCRFGTRLQAGSASPSRTAELGTHPVLGRISPADRPYPRRSTSIQAATPEAPAATSTAGQAPIRLAKGCEAPKPAR